MAASIPPLGFWYLAYLGLGLLAWRLAGLRGRARLLAGLVWGIGLFGPTLEWVTSFNSAGYGALVLIESAFFALACLLVPPRRGRAFAFPVMVTLAEAARSAWPFGGLPMGGVPLGQASGPLLAVARVGGPLLVTGLSAVVGVALAELAHLAGDWYRTTGPSSVPSVSSGATSVPSGPGSGLSGATIIASGPHGAARHGDAVGPTIRYPPSGWGHLGVAVAAVAVVAAAVAGAALAPTGGPPIATVRVGLVQGGGPRGLRAIDVNPDVIYRAQVDATTEVHPPVSLVVWPEDVISLTHPLKGSAVAAEVGSLARALHATLIAGVTQDVGATRFTNQAVVWSPTGAIVGSYEKVHRVPFGEYVPMRSLFRHIVSLVDVPRDAIPGHRPGFLRTAAGPVGVMLSYEVFFASRARAAVRAGAQMLVVPTNTSSYATDLVPAQEVAADKLRAVEEGRDLVQASPVGYTTVVNQGGRVEARSALGPRQVIQATIARRDGTTLYERGGDVPVLVAAGILALLAWALAWASRRGTTAELPASRPVDAMAVDH